VLTVKTVLPDGVGAELGIEIGDQLVAFDGNPFTDIIDYVYFDSLTETTLTVLSRGVEYECEVEKDEGETFGLEFEEKLPTSCCRNRCVFCFVDQLPKGMRRTLYVKDDDWRWSLISGNYVTLTNLSDVDFDRIVRYGISPLYISVHAITPEVRAKLLGNENAEILQKLVAFRNAGIRTHAQIVLVPGMNDGEELEKTLRALKDVVASVAVVPVGLTCHRKTPLPDVTAELAGVVIDTVERFASEPNACGERNWVLASDEFYVRAGRPLPSYEAYGAFEQIDDGVGLIAKLTREFDEALRSTRRKPLSRAVDLATGVDSYPVLSELARKAEQKFEGLSVCVHRVENKFFGDKITVSGLVVGRDLIDQLQGKLTSRTLFIPQVMIRAGGDVFLDDVALCEVEQALSTAVVPVKVDGRELLLAMLGK